MPCVLTLAPLARTYALCHHVLSSRSANIHRRRRMRVDPVSLRCASRTHCWLPSYSHVALSSLGCTHFLSLAISRPFFFFPFCICRPVSLFLSACVPSAFSFLCCCVTMHVTLRGTAAFRRRGGAYPPSSHSLKPSSRLRLRCLCPVSFFTAICFIIL